MPMTTGEIQMQRSAVPALEALQTILEIDIGLPLSRALSMTGLSPRSLSREFHVSELPAE
jgi:hypothetical protein